MTITATTPISLGTQHHHRVQLYCSICRGCKRAFYQRQECCLPVGSYCDRCIVVTNPHFDHQFATGVNA